MKKIIFCSLLLLSISFVYAQESDIHIAGKAVDDMGESFPGISINKKGSTLGTLTDVFGDFSLSLPAGEHTIEISIIGYRTAEIKVNRSEYWNIVFYDESFEVERKANHLPSREPVLSYELRSKADGEGVFYLKDDMPASYSSVSSTRIKSIDASGKGFKLKEAIGKRYLTGKKIDYTSSVKMSSIGRLPETGTHSPKDFFRSGISFGNALNIKTPAFGMSNIDIVLGQSKDNSPIPNAYQEAYNASMILKDIKTGMVDTDAGMYYNHSNGRLTQQGSNIATLMHAVFTTPPTFDNRNGLSKKDPRAWTNADGSYRSYDPASVDNPYALINELPDKEKSDYLMAFLKNRYKIDNIEWQNNISFDKLLNRFNNGTLPYLVPQRISMREDNISNVTFTSGFEWKVRTSGLVRRDRDTELSLRVDYGFRHTNDELRQTNKFSQSSATAVEPFEKKLIRNTHNIKYGLKYSNYKVLAEIANGHYSSNTSRSKDYINLFPEFGLRMYNLLSSYKHRLLFYGNIKRSIGEVSLADRSPAVLSTILNTGDFRNYHEYQLPVYNNQLKPEIYVKSEAGLIYNINRFNFEVNGFNNLTYDLTAPVMENSVPELNNIGRLRSYGYIIALSYLERYVNVKYSFSRGRTKATAVYGDDPFIRLGGFSDIATVFAEDRPLGALYGTAYQRNVDGQVATDQNGNPVVNTELSEIGDPTPDFIMTLNPTITYRNFSLNFNVEYSHGGDRWNGTKAFMDNGMAGVGEAYIEKADFLRMSDISLIYHYRPWRRSYSKFIRQISVELSAQNLFLVTSYRGVDPSTLLFGYPLNNGLDLFNAPSVRSFLLSINFTF